METFHSTLSTYARTAYIAFTLALAAFLASCDTSSGSSGGGQHRR